MIEKEEKEKICLLSQHKPRNDQEMLFSPVFASEKFLCKYQGIFRGAKPRTGSSGNRKCT